MSLLCYYFSVFVSYVCLLSCLHRAICMTIKQYPVLNLRLILVPNIDKMFKWLSYSQSSSKYCVYDSCGCILHCCLNSILCGQKSVKSYIKEHTNWIPSEICSSHPKWPAGHITLGSDWFRVLGSNNFHCAEAVNWSLSSPSNLTNLLKIFTLAYFKMIQINSFIVIIIIIFISYFVSTFPLLCFIFHFSGFKIRHSCNSMDSIWNKWMHFQLWPQPKKGPSHSSLNFHIIGKKGSSCLTWYVILGYP